MQRAKLAGLVIEVTAIRVEIIFCRAWTKADFCREFASPPVWLHRLHRGSNSIGEALHAPHQLATDISGD
jgi:hypothetical protein